MFALSSLHAVAVAGAFGWHVAAAGRRGFDFAGEGLLRAHQAFTTGDAEFGDAGAAFDLHAHRELAGGVAGGAERGAVGADEVGGGGVEGLEAQALGGDGASAAFVRFTRGASVSGAGDAGVLIFDEADVGVGGAVAAAIGERMLTLSKDRQILSITHSPQVAASADAQWRISKDSQCGSVFETSIDVLECESRQEEIARMLAGAKITQEARAAADRLLARA